MPKNVFAHTDAGADQPQFLSVNREDDGTFTVHARSPREIGGQAQTSIDARLARELGLALIQATN